MIGIYFSGTGNSKHALQVFLQACDPNAKVFSIEDNGVAETVTAHRDIVFSYPVQYSTVPKILRDFVINNKALWYGRRVFVIATMGLFSGDGSGVLARLLKKYGAEIIGGLHLKMPDSIADERVLKRSPEINTRLVRAAEKKLRNAAARMNAGHPPQEGIGLLYRLAGFWGQRLYFGGKTRHYCNSLKIDDKKCVGCGKCVRLCPMKNIELVNGRCIAHDQCTLCYRCINYCPKQAITLLGKAVVTQSFIEKYL